MKKIKLLFWLNKSKQNQQGLAPLYLRITVQGKRIERATPYTIPWKNWDSKGQRVKGKHELTDMINNHIDLTRVQVHHFQSSSQLTRTKLTPFLVKEFLLGKSPDQKSLLEVFRYHNARVKEQVGQVIVLATYKRYEVTRRKLEVFLSLIHI